MCRRHEIFVEEVKYTKDLWSRVPLLDVETMLALVCRACRHVQILHPVPEELHRRPIQPN
jgi:hypothetical protein